MQAMFEACYACVRQPKTISRSNLQLCWFPMTLPISHHLQVISNYCSGLEFILKTHAKIFKNQQCYTKSKNDPTFVHTNQLVGYIHFLPWEITTSLQIPITFNCKTKPNQPKCKIAKLNKEPLELLNERHFVHSRHNLLYTKHHNLITQLSHPQKFIYDGWVCIAQFILILVVDLPSNSRISHNQSTFHASLYSILVPNHDCIRLPLNLESYQPKVCKQACQGHVFSSSLVVLPTYLPTFLVTMFLGLPFSVPSGQCLMNAFSHDNCE